MRILISTTLFALVGAIARDNNNLVTEYEIKVAYDAFVNTLKEYCETTSSVIDLLRVLCYTRLELLSIQERIGDNKAMGYIKDCCVKIQGMLQCEEEIARQRIEHPNLNNAEPIRVVSALHWKGHISGIMEMISSLDFSNHVVTDEGVKQAFSTIVSHFEWLFNVKIDKPYDQRARLAQRKRRISVLLSELKTAFEKNIKLCNLKTK